MSDFKLIEEANKAIKNGKVATVKKTVVNGESVNNIPSSFKGAFKLPKAGIVGPEEYDFEKVVESTDTYSRLVADVQGKYVKNQTKENMEIKNATLWGGAISMLQKKASIVIDGEAAFAVLN